MYFDRDCVFRMITDLQYMRLMNLNGAKQRLTDLVRDAVELRSVLTQYPEVRYQPLDYHYVLLKYMAAFNVKVLTDLMSGEYTWRGIVVGGWLACLNPSRENLARLSSVTQSQFPHNSWIIRLAIAEAARDEWCEDGELQNLIAQLRECLAPVALPKFSLTPEADPPKVEEIRAAYHAACVGKALYDL